MRPLSIAPLGLLLLLLFSGGAGAFSYSAVTEAPVGGQWQLILDGHDEQVNLTLYDWYGATLRRESHALNGTLILWFPAPSSEGTYSLEIVGTNGTGRTRTAFLALSTFCGEECQAARIRADNARALNAFLGSFLLLFGAGVVMYSAVKGALSWHRDRPFLGFPIRTPRIFPLKDNLPRERPEYVRLDEMRHLAMREIHEAAGEMGRYAAELEKLTAPESRLWELVTNATIHQADNRVLKAFYRSRAARRRHRNVSLRMRQIVKDPVVDPFGIPAQVFRPQKRPKAPELEKA